MGARQIVLVFLAALGAYAAAYFGMEHLRHRKGPWVVEFATADSGEPVLTVRQSHLGVESVRLRFPGERVASPDPPGRVVFDAPNRAVPFGRVIYEDLTSLPGVVTFELFGHEIELLPRVLIVNKREIPWEAHQDIALRPEEKPIRLPQPPKGGTREKDPSLGLL